MQRVHVTIGFASLLGGALVAGPAMAVTAYSPTGHLNVRSGPGFQYPVVNQIQANTPAQITGCVTDYSWCAAAERGLLRNDADYSAGDRKRRSDGRCDPPCCRPGLLHAVVPLRPFLHQRAEDSG
jgi:hypothetical protein